MGENKTPVYGLDINSKAVRNLPKHCAKVLGILPQDKQAEMLDKLHEAFMIYVNWWDEKDEEGNYINRPE